MLALLNNPNIAHIHGLDESGGVYSANVRFNYTSKGPIDDANAGPYTADRKQVALSQWVHVHVRPGDRKEPMLSRKGPDETTSYHFEGNRLILTFPSNDGR